MAQISKKHITPLLFESYMSMIRNSAGSRMFQHAYALVHGRKIDILRSGDLSCAFFVSSILALFHPFKLIQNPPHSTVAGTIKDMKRMGWKEAKKLRPGSVILWESLVKNGHVKSGNKHLGFYIGGNKAVSNSSKARTPIIHHVTFGQIKGKPVRRIEGIFWNKKLES